MKACGPLFAAAVLAASSHASAHGKGCVERSDVTGDRICSRYGSDWSAERIVPMSVAIGPWSSHLEPRGRSWVASAKGSSASVGVAGAALGFRAIDTVGVGFRAVGHLSPFAYLGVDAAVAFAAARGDVQATGAFTFRDRQTLDFVHMRQAVVGGARVPLGRLSLRVEALVGFDVASYALDVLRASALDVQRGSGTFVRGSVTSFELLLEPRVVAEVWTSPWTTVSAWWGQSFLRPNDRAMGLLLGLHGRTFDGRFTL